MPAQSKQTSAVWHSFLRFRTVEVVEHTSPSLSMKTSPDAVRRSLQLPSKVSARREPGTALRVFKEVVYMRPDTFK